MPREDPGPWRRMRLWTAAHAIDDMYQGLVPASVPYFVLDRHYSYVAASGLALAATLAASSLPSSGPSPRPGASMSYSRRPIASRPTIPTQGTIFRRLPAKPKVAASSGPTTKPQLPVALIFACLVVVYVGIRYYWR